MADKLMYNPYDDTENYPFCRLQLVVETFGHSSWWTNQSKFNKVSKLVKPTISQQANKKTLFKDFGD